MQLASRLLLCEMEYYSKPLLFEGKESSSGNIRFTYRSYRTVSEKRLTQKAAFLNCGKCKSINDVRLVYADVKMFEKRICMKCHSLLNQLQNGPGNWDKLSSMSNQSVFCFVNISNINCARMRVFLELKFERIYFHEPCLAFSINCDLQKTAWKGGNLEICNS